MKPEPKLPLNLQYEPGESNRKLVRKAWQVCGFRKGRYPSSLRDTLNLAKLCGFDGTTELYTDAVESGAFTPPKNGKWSEDDVVRYMDHLEGERAFQPCHPVHIHKLSPEELRQANEQRETLEEFGAYCQSLEVQDLLRLMIVSMNERNRELIGAVISEKIGLLRPSPQRN